MFQSLTGSYSSVKRNIHIHKAQYTTMPGDEVTLRFDSHQDIVQTHEKLTEIAREVKNAIEEEETDELIELQRALFYITNGKNNNPNKHFGFGYAIRTNSSGTVRFRSTEEFREKLRLIESTSTNQLLTDEKEMNNWIQEILSDAQNAIDDIRNASNL